MSSRLAVLFVATLIASVSAVAHADNWPCWRGPRGDGTTRETRLPLHWSGPAGENIAWQTEIPGIGHASPIVWGDRVFLVSCREKSEDRNLLCLDRSDGHILWERTVLHAPLERKHVLNSRASSTPATDGRLVYVSFAAIDPSAPPGDRSFTNEKQSPEAVDPCEMVVAAYDFDGRRQWIARPGKFASKHGFCSPPVLFENLVILNGDYDGDAYLVALDRATGKTVWKMPRENKTRSYSTPIIRQLAGRTQMVLSGSLCVASYDPRSGKQLWKLDGPTEQFVASAVDNGKLVFITAGFPEFHIVAVRPDASGQLGPSSVVWHTTKGCAYVPSPIVAGRGKHFLVVSDGGVASCFEAATGERHWTERIGTHYSASLVGNDDLVYFLADDGVMKVVRAGPNFDLVAENPLGQSCRASPAISDGQIFLRGETRVYCIGKRADSPQPPSRARQ